MNYFILTFYLAYIPFENHNVTEHGRVFLYWHPKKDLKGVKLRVIRGVYDIAARPPIKDSRNKHRARPENLESVEDWLPEPVQDIYNYM